jgi:hypothetical protein
VIIERSAHKTALVFWSASCDDCTAQVRDLTAEGAHVVAILTDTGVGMGGEALGVPVISDADGRLQRLFQLQQGVVVLSEAGTVEATIAGEPLAARSLLFPVSCEHILLTAQVSSR